MRYLLTMLILTFSVSLNAAVKELNLLVRTDIVVPDVVMNSERNTLSENDVLRVGIWGAAQPPLYIDNDHHAFEGLTADYLGAVQRMLKLRMQLIYFPTEEAMAAALAAGTLHMVAIYNPETLMLTPPLIRTTPYLLDSSVILQNTKNNNDKSLTRKIIAWAGPQRIGLKLQQDYPEAILQHHQTYAKALAATAFRQADATWGNASTQEYLLRYGYSNELTMSPSRALSNLNISFGVSPRYPELAEALNMALRMIPLAGRLRIANRWQLQSHYVMKNNPLALTPQEDNWLRLHPFIPIDIAANGAPLFFRDESGTWQGIAKEIVDLISGRAGVLFEPVTPGQHASVDSTKVHFSPAVLLDEQQRAQHLFSRPYLISPWVLVQAVDTANILEMAGKKNRRVFSLNESRLNAYMAETWPDITLQTQLSPQEALLQLLSGKADGVIIPKVHADFLLRNYYRDRLRIIQVVGEQPAKIGMAVDKANAPLIEIINKALLDIPPETLEPLISRWHNLPQVNRTISWHDYKDVVLKIVALASIIILICLVWNRHLQRVIRQRTEAQHALKDQLTFTNTLFNESPVVMYVRDRQARLMHCNTAYLDFLEVSLEDVVGKGTDVYRHLLDESCLQLLESEHYTTLRQGTASMRDVKMQFRGKTVHVFHWALPFRDRLGAVVGVIGGWLDVTERHELLLALSTAKEDADAANRSKSQFLASMSHEIRTPLHAIIGLLEMETRQKPAREISNNVLVAYESANALLSLIGDILDLSRIESGIHQPKPEPCLLAQRVEQVINLFRNKAESKNIELRHEIDITYPCVLLDAMMFNQIFSNLLSNAIKFTDRGYVSVTLYQGSIDMNEQRGEFVLEIEDSGCGLDEDQQQAIFEPFVQTGDRQRQQLGTGLGLSICRKLAELMGGEIDVESQPGEGAVFRFHFYAPLVDEQQVQQQQAENVPAQGRLRIMVIDDHAPNRLLLGQQLEYAGHQAMLIESAIQALVIWQQDPDAFDLIISDCNMPDMDGFTFARQLRALEQQLQRPRMLIFGLTASAERSIIQRCLDAGMDDCLFKPLSVDTLTRHLSNTTRHLSPPAPATAQQRPQSALPAPCPLLQELAERDMAGCLAFIDSIIVSNDEILTEINAAHDSAQLSQLGHKMKGGARLINATDVERLAKQLEDKPPAEAVMAIKSGLAHAIAELEKVLLAFKNSLNH